MDATLLGKYETVKCYLGYGLFDMTSKLQHVSNQVVEKLT